MATAGVINGTDFIMYDSKTPIAAASSHTLTQAMATSDASSKDSAGWKYIKPGQRSWSASGNGLYTFDSTYGYSQLKAILDARTKVMVKLSTSNTTNKYYYGYGYLTQLDAEFPNEETSTYSWSFEGDGPLTEGTGT